MGSRTIVSRIAVAPYERIAKIIGVPIQRSMTILWANGASVQAEMGAKVRRLLAKYDYPPDLEEKAVELVLQQAELSADQESHQ